MRFVITPETRISELISYINDEQTTKVFCLGDKKLTISLHIKCKICKQFNRNSDIVDRQNNICWYCSKVKNESNKDVKRLEE